MDAQPANNNGAGRELYRLQNVQAITGAAGDRPENSNLLRFYTPERRLYARLVGTLNQDAQRCMTIVSLWLYLEAIGHYGFIRHLQTAANYVVLRYFQEANTCLECILGRLPLNLLEFTAMPLTSVFIQEPINLRFFSFNKHPVLKGVNKMLESLCNSILDDAHIFSSAEDRDINRGSVDRYQLDRPTKAPSTAGSIPKNRDSTRDEEGGNLINKNLSNLQSALRAATRAGDQVPESRPKDKGKQIDYAAYLRKEAPAPEEERSVFVNCLPGRTFAAEDILGFFNEKNGTGGPCVVKMLLEQDVPSHKRMFGRVVFSTPAAVDIVLDGQLCGKFYIKETPLWVRVCKRPPWVDF